MIFENKKMNLKVDANRPSNYASLVLFCYEVPSQEPLTLASINKDLKIMRVLEDNLEAESFEIEDSFKDSIKAVVAKTPFSLRHPELGEFGEYIENL